MDTSDVSYTLITFLDVSPCCSLSFAKAIGMGLEDLELNDSRLGTMQSVEPAFSCIP